MPFLPDILPRTSPSTRVMIFVDGENLTIRYQANAHGLLAHVQHERDVFVWSQDIPKALEDGCSLIRTYYYASLQGDNPKIEEVQNRLKALRVGQPRVFKKQKNRRSKRVDITLAVDMLSHAQRGNFDLAVLVAGDEDYVPLLEAVKAEGARVAVWFIPDGLSSALRLAADHFFDLSRILLEPRIG